jgi:integrase
MPDSIQFDTAARAWLDGLMSQRNPIKPASYATFSSFVRQHIIPDIGHLELTNFGNSDLKRFVAQLEAKQLSARTIAQIVTVIKQIISAQTNSEGDELFPKKWNSRFIDAPSIENTDQPCATKEQIEEILLTKSLIAPIVALLGFSGLRIGESLALRIGRQDGVSHWNPEESTLVIRTSIWRGREQRPKTPSAERTVDLPESANNYLKEFASDKTGAKAGDKTGFLFGNGRCAVESTLRAELAKTPLARCGFHSLRRFRTTWLRKQRALDDLVRFWLGHSNKTVTDSYSKLKEDVEFRKAETERIGLGFSL